MKRSYYILIIVVAAVLLGYYGVNALFSKSYDIPTYTVERSDFVISLNENGTIQAKRAMTISAPRIRGIQITWLAPEGSTIQEGDPVIKFDATQQQSDLVEHQSNLKIFNNNLERAQKEYTIQEKQLRLNLEKAKRNYDEKKYEAPRIAEEAKLEYELAELNFDAKLEQLKADVQKAEVEVQRSQEKVNKAQRELDQMTLRAPIPGLVVYLEIWKGGQMEKVQEGDSPWSGQGLVNIPDLSEMIVETTVSEVDANKVDIGQRVMVQLDAFPGVMYRGTITKKGTLARKKEPSSKINVFDVQVTIENVDDRLKPGMSASARIVIDRLTDVIAVPLESVFEREGKTIVYMSNKKARDVELGRKNDMSIEVVTGLEEGEKICLLDPTLDEPTLPGDKATQPEINRDKTKVRKRPEGTQSKRGR